MTTQGVLAFAAFAALLTITPGLDTVLVLRTAAAEGARPAFAAGLGICLGVLGWALAGGLGLTALLAASRIGYDILRFAGAGYLAYLGARLLWRSWRHDPPSEQPPAPAPRSATAAFRVGLTTNLLNPKVGVFYLSVLPQFLPQENAALGAAVLGGIHAAEGVVWFAVIIVAITRVRAFLARPVVARRLDRVVGVVFLGFGARLLLAQGR